MKAAEKSSINLAGKIKLANKDGRAALIVFYPFGYPDIIESIDIINEIADIADVVEIGIPFSDPVADGTVIQKAYEQALKKKATLSNFFENTKLLKPDRTFVLMTYLNPAFKIGFPDFFENLRKANISGVIFPDLPVEEKVIFREIAPSKRVPVILLAAPGESELRLEKICRETEGFLYLVSGFGVTGEREGLPDDLFNRVKNARKYCKLPVCVGFGISHAKQAAMAAKVADGVITGSAVVRRAFEAESKKDRITLVCEFLQSLKESLKKD